MQKLFSLIKSHWFIFCFYFCYSGKWDIEDLIVLYVSVLPMFSSKSFTVSGLAFRSFIHFEIIFVYGVRECSHFILLHEAVRFLCFWWHLRIMNRNIKAGCCFPGDYLVWSLSGLRRRGWHQQVQREIKVHCLKYTFEETIFLIKVFKSELCIHTQTTPLPGTQFVK